MQKENRATFLKRLFPAILVTALLTLVGIMGVVLVFAFSGAYNVAAINPHTPLFRWAVSKSLARSVRVHSEEIPAPDLGDSTLLRHGSKHYRTMCINCHGEPGADPSDIGKGLNPEAPELSKNARKWSDSEMHWIIRNGIRMTGMPAFGESHDEREIWGLVAFIRSMEGSTPQQYRQLVETFAEDSHSMEGMDKGSMGEEENVQGPGKPVPWKKRSLF